MKIGMLDLQDASNITRCVRNTSYIKGIPARTLPLIGNGLNCNIYDIPLYFRWSHIPT